MSVLPLLRACELPALPETQRWLVEHLWAQQAVGLVGGEPKSCKSFLALELAAGVASGAAVLQRFRVTQPGRVLLFAAEDALHVVRERLAGIAAARGVTLDRLDLHVITSPSLRLDLRHDVERLDDTIATLRPRLLVLDPFVRLHRADENVSAEVAPLLASLRELQRAHGCAVLLVHHARKGASAARPGQALRGSSELHAWGDSNLYLRRLGDEMTLSVEHRAASSIAALTLRLRAETPALALEIVESAATSDALQVASLHERIRGALETAAGPLTLEALRAACRVRKSALCAALAELVRDGVVLRAAGGYLLAAVHA
jgi:RecA-family ATPase